MPNSADNPARMLGARGPIVSRPRAAPTPAAERCGFSCRRVQHHLDPNNSFAAAFDETNDLAARSRPFPSASLSADRNLIPPRVSTFLAMNSGVFKARTRRSRVQLSKALQETLLDAVADNIAGAHIDVPGYQEDLLTIRYRASAELPRAVSRERRSRRRRDTGAGSEKATRRDRERSVAREESPIDTDGHATAWS